MPRTRKTPEQPQPNAIVASAARVIAGKRTHIPRTAGAGWQNAAWEMLDAVGELEFYREWIANALSRCTLSVVEVNDDDEEIPVTEGLAAEAMDALFGGDASQPEMLAGMGGHLAIVGETWLCGLLEPSTEPDGPDLWRVLSRDEVSEEGDRWKIDRGDGQPETYAKDEVYMTRIWRPHPRKWVEAHSAVRSALPILRELVGYSKHDAATLDSRLAGAGVLLVPNEVTFASPVNDGDDPTDASLDPLLAALIDAMVTAIRDRDDPSAVAPTIVRGPGEHLDKIKHLTFSTPFDAKTEEKKTAALKRLANSLDIPAEVLLGMADVNHWTGWLLDENAIKMHIEPLLSVVTAGITTRYLWPILQGNALTFDPALRRFKVKGDTSALRQRPNRSAEAEAARQGIVIKDAAWARETGFDPEDLLDPEDPEFKRRVLMRLATTGSPEVAVGALAALGIPVPLPAAVPPGGGEGAAVPPAPAPPAIESRRDIPEQAAALMAAAEPLVMRAIERAWNKAGKRGRVRQPIPATEVDACMTGAWEYADRTAALLGVDANRLRNALDLYTRNVLIIGSPHKPGVLADVLAGVPEA